MQAIIMAGGEGERLRPLTCDMPKPMAPVMGRPVMEYALALLKTHGVTRAAVTLKYLPDAIRSHFGDGRDFGVELTYFTEETPLGTAGGVAQARDYLRETFLVLSGDGLTDCDLTAALRSHVASGAEATMVLTRVEDPREYGLVERDGSGRVTRFVEKPQWSQVRGDAANAGIYILEPGVLDRIPKGTFCDFGRDVFPAMLREGRPIHTFLWEGYWCDIGDLDAYRRANRDALTGRFSLPGMKRPGIWPDTEKQGLCPGEEKPEERQGTEKPGLWPDTEKPGLCPGEEKPGKRQGTERSGIMPEKPGLCPGVEKPEERQGTEKPGLCPGMEKPGVRREKGSRVDPTATLEAPCWIGENASVAARAFVGAYSVVGNGATLGQDASVKRCVLLSGAHVGDGCEARGAILMEDARMEPGSRAFEGSVLGARSVLGAGATLDPECRVWPDKQLAPGVRYEGSVVWGSPRRETTRSGRLYPGDVEKAARMAAAWQRAAKNASVLVARGPSAASQACALAVEGALLAMGVQVYDGGACAVPEARRGLWSLGTDGAAYVSFEEGILLWDSRGAELPGPVRRKMNGYLRRGDGERPFTRILRPAAPAGRLDLSYAAGAADGCSAGGALAAVYSDDTRLLALSEAVFERAGASIRTEWDPERMVLGPKEVGIWLQNDGQNAIFMDETGMLTEAENQLLPLWAMLEAGYDRLILPHDATRAAESLAEKRGARVERVCGERSRWMEALLEQGRDAFSYHFDGIFLGLRVAAALQNAGLTLDQWRQEAPRLYRKTRVVRFEGGRARAMGRIMASPRGGDMDEGMCCHDKGGWAWVCPSEDRDECRVVAESAREETARDLCDELCGLLGEAKRGEEQ